MVLEIGRRILKHYYQSRERKKSELKRMENELNIGHGIQMGMLTTDFPKSDEIEVHAALKPAMEVGGDMYDVFYIDKEHLCCCVADVSGKGVPAALFMAITKTLIKSVATSRKNSFTETADKSKKYSTAAIMKHVNDELCSGDNYESMFVTVFLCIINIKTGDIVYTNAGHNPPYIMNHRKELKKIDKRHGLVLAAMAEVDYGEDELKLNARENFIIYTDGVTEAFNESREMYTEKRFENVIMKANFQGTKNLVTLLLDSVLEFEGESGQTDDITVMAIQKI